MAGDRRQSGGLVRFDLHTPCRAFGLFALRCRGFSGFWGEGVTCTFWFDALSPEAGVIGIPATVRGKACLTVIRCADFADGLRTVHAHTIRGYQ